MKIKNYFILFTLFNFSCGIYSFTGADIHPNIESFSVDYFQNQADLVQPFLSQEFTTALQDRFLQQTDLSIVRSGGDIHFEGYISDYFVRPISISSNDQANQNRLTITIFTRFENHIEPEKSYEQKFTRFADFDSNLPLSSVEENMIDEIIIELIEDIFNKAVVNW
tara:strand:- start:3495 stop:3992 length:498 start_codon:yes stop_codon:yes gene_type:complete